mmetsp:Transcript_20258/g.41512  ORF Transcript_20258/g.41512 Transcript_20258/m.41512 type:complete len:514 (-) Transcript_20258:102-1643(-)
MSGWLWSAGPTWQQELQSAETALLRSVPWGESTYECHDTPISFRGEPHHIRTIVAYTAPASSSQEASLGNGVAPTVNEGDIPLVLWHGFGQGAGSWWRCLPHLAQGHGQAQGQAPGAKLKGGGGSVYALDWLGVGLSSRPSWSTPAHRATAAEPPPLQASLKATCTAEGTPAEGAAAAATASEVGRQGAAASDVGAPQKAAASGMLSPSETEAFFVESLEAWREAEGITRFHLVAHSLSAFFAVAYAEKYPGRLESLVLASPAGVPPAPEQTMMERVEAMPWGFRRFMFGFAGSLWESGTSPQSVVRASGKWVGKSLLVDGYVFRRFKDENHDGLNTAAAAASQSAAVDTGAGADAASDTLSPQAASQAAPAQANTNTAAAALPVPPVNKELFSNYMYAHMQGEACGEHALACLLQPGAVAKEPLCDRIPFLDSSLPLTFIYGETDWMDVGAGRDTMRSTRIQRTSKPSEPSDPSPPGSVGVLQLERCGHQLYIENPKDFSAAVLKACLPRGR